MKITDHIGYQFELKETPKRIISLVPSQTELLYDLGLNEKVVGITKFCVHPKEWFDSKPRVGGTKTLNFDKIKALNPDLIIANKEENTQSEIEFLQRNYPVYTSDISNLDESLDMILSLGEITQSQEKSATIIQNIIERFNSMSVNSFAGKSVLYLIWQNPFMSIGSQTFINDMLKKCGLQNLMESKERYPELDQENIKALKPDFIFLASEPFPFKEKHINEFERISPNSKIVLVDGEYFSWYGSRLQQAPNYFVDLLNKIS